MDKGGHHVVYLTLREALTQLAVCLQAIQRSLSAESLDDVEKLIETVRGHLQALPGNLPENAKQELKEFMDRCEADVRFHECSLACRRGEFSLAKNKLKSAREFTQEKGLDYDHLVAHAYAEIEMRQGIVDQTVLDGFRESLRRSLELNDWHQAGNAAFNLATILKMQGSPEAEVLWKVALAYYLISPTADRAKLADSFHMLGANLRGEGSQDEESLMLLGRALNEACGRDDYPAIERISGDLARSFLCLYLETGHEAWLTATDRFATMGHHARETLWERAISSPEASRASLTVRAQNLYNNMETELHMCALQEAPGRAWPLLAMQKGRIERVFRENGWKEQIEGYRESTSDFDLSKYSTEQLGAYTLPRAAMRLAEEADHPVAFLEHYAMSGDSLVVFVCVAEPDDSESGILVAPWTQPNCPNRHVGAVLGRHQGSRGRGLVERIVEAFERFSDMLVYLETDDTGTLTAQGKEAAEADYACYKEDLDTLGRWLFPEPILEMLEELKVGHVVLSPDPRMFSLPWSALGLGRRGVLVDQTWTLSLVQSSMGIHDILRRRRSSTDGVVILAPDLDVNENRGGQLDIDAIRAARPNAQVFVGTAASLDQLAESAMATGWIHVRAHGRPVEGEYYPVFHDKCWNDETIVRSKFSCLVMAACGTGATRHGGLDLRGFTTVVDGGDFRALVAPVYPVDGVATGLWMKKFYQSLGQGQGIAAACQAASQAAREQLVHPCFWAPMICVGDFGATLAV
ncbi:MAG: CHAT domain-containing protein [Vulcanimicrobiota bacterium]